VAERIRLTRAKGSVRPAGVVVCDRSTVWGNPWRLTDAPDGMPVAERPLWVVRQYARDLAQRRGVGGEWDDDFIPLEELRRRLAGRDLGCWCPLDAWCHATDVLMPVAAGVEPAVVFRFLPLPDSVAELAARIDAATRRPV
jgi:hypothetical protein